MTTPRPGSAHPARRAWAAGALLLLALAGQASAAELTMEVTLNREQIYLGEALQMTVNVKGSQNPPSPPDVSAIADADVRLLGSHAQNYFSTRLVNGRMQHDSFEGRVFIYEVTPRRKGTVLVGPVTLDTGSQRLHEPGRSVTVQGVEAQEDVRITIEGLRESVLVDEPFEITLTLLLKRIGQPQYAHIDPLDPNNPPRLEAPFLNPTPIDGLETPDIRGLLQQHLVQDGAQPGFNINNYTISPDIFSFGLLAGERSAKFRLAHEPRVIDGRSYFAYTLTLRYLPVKEGSYTFGPALFKGNIVTAVDRGGYPRLKPIFAIGPAFTVNVVPPPEEGRPATFIGAIGTDLKLTTGLDTQVCKVGDPLTLTLDLSGPVRFENVVPPRLALQPQLTNDFRIYDDTLRTEPYEQGRRYAYTVRPTRVGTYELPPVEIAYFHSPSRTYRVVRSDPIPLKAAGAVDVDAAAIVGLATNRTGALRLSISRADAMPAPVTLSGTHARRESLVSVMPTAVIAGVGPALFVTAWGLRGLGIMLARRRAGKGRRLALRRARRRLGAAGAPRDAAQAREILRRAMGQYLQDRFDIEAGAITPADAARVLADPGLPASARERFLTLYEQAFNDAFAGGSGNTAGADQEPPANVRAALEAIEAIEAWAAAPTTRPSDVQGEDTV